MNRRLAQRLAAVAAPVAVVSDEREVIYCNQACGEWLGVEAEVLIGWRADFHSPTGDDAVELAAAALAPPPEALAGQLVQGSVACTRRGGQQETRKAVFLPLGDDQVQCGGVVIVLSLADSPPSVRAEDDEAGALHEQLQQLRKEFSRQFELAHFIGQSAAAERIRRQVLLAQRSATRTLIFGPPGSGREHVARTIHHSGDKGDRPPLIPLTCELLDAELLQQTVTAFSRRVSQQSDGESGALLLLEADLLPLDAQAELAGFLNLPTFDLHILSTARRPLLAMAEAGQYRDDLAFALSTLVIELPPLCERAEDIPLLAQHHLEAANVDADVQHSGFTSEALDMLVAYHWPQNINELAAVVSEAHRNASGHDVTAADLPIRLHHAARAAACPPKEVERIDLDGVLEEVERELIARALARSKGNKSKAAEMLSITRARLHRRVKDLKIE